jgi:hypothetical protein
VRGQGEHGDVAGRADPRIGADVGLVVDVDADVGVDGADADEAAVLLRTDAVTFTELMLVMVTSPSEATLPPMEALMVPL